MLLRGRMLTESLRTGAVVEVPDLRVVRLWREDVSGSTSPGQPSVWTFLDFEAPAERADELGEALAAALLPDDGWYADFEVGPDRVVVFAGRAFRYRKDDVVARSAVIAYGRRAGTPEHQLDWGD